MPVSLSKRTTVVRVDPAIGDPADVLTFVLSLDLDVLLRDKRVLEGVTTDGLVRYLTYHGWKPAPPPDRFVQSSDGERSLEFWERSCDNGAVSEVLVPLSADKRDFLLRVADAVTEIAFAVGRNKLAVVLELRAACGALNTPAAL